MVGVEDYPYCIYCDSKISYIRLSEREVNIVEFICECGEIIEVEMNNAERLLSDPRSAEGS